MLVSNKNLKFCICCIFILCVVSYVMLMCRGMYVVFVFGFVCDVGCDLYVCVCDVYVVS